MNTKESFPIFKNNPGLIFLDNASTTQKPDMVIKKVIEFYSLYNSNVHRGLYPIAEKADLEYQNAREKIAKFINADPDEIIFTSGTTEGVNLVANSLLNSGLISGESRIATTKSEHHSSFLPFINIFEKQFDFISLYNPEKTYDIVIYSLISNVTGAYTDIKRIKKGPLKDALFIADAAQAVAHKKIDVKEMDVDFLVFSGHKMFGPTGIGVLYIKKTLITKLEPSKVGGGMIDSVSTESVTWKKDFSKFEAGTPNIAGAIGLGAAVDFIESVSINEIQTHERELTKYLLESLKKIPGIKLFHEDSIDSGAVVSFTIDKIHPHDIAQFLGEKGICVRAGHHCAQILHKEVFNIPASVRVSLSIYNTKEEVDTLCAELLASIKYFSKKPSLVLSL